MNRQAREQIIAAEVRKLERKQAIERAGRRMTDREEPAEPQGDDRCAPRRPRIKRPPGS